MNPNLTASQIADLKFGEFEAKQSTFDFGTNTGQALELAKATFGSDVFLKREDESFNLLKLAEAARASFNPTFHAC